MAKSWRLILNNGNTGFYNMAVDEALFKLYSVSDIPTFRVYTWSEPSLSIGLRQNPTKILATNPGIPYIKRITGGGTIYHYNEITYSITVGKDILGVHYNIKETYKHLCGFLKLFYGCFNVKAEFACDKKLNEPLGELSDFCFKKREQYDLLIDGRKIGGNAQRWSSHHLLQHGSIPIRLKHCRAMCLSDFTEITDKSVLSEKLVKSFSDYFNVTLYTGSLNNEEQGFVAKREAELKAIYEKGI